MLEFEGGPAHERKVDGVTFRARHNGRRIMCDISAELILDEIIGCGDDASDADLIAACRENFGRLKAAAAALIEAGCIEQRSDNVGEIVDRVLIRTLP